MLTRSSQSTFISPGDGIGPDICGVPFVSVVGMPALVGGVSIVVQSLRRSSRSWSAARALTRRQPWRQCSMGLELRQLAAEERMTTHVATVDWSFTEQPMDDAPTWHGLSRNVLVGPAQGAVHTELAIGALFPGGWLQRHFHSFEEALYVLAGDLIVEIDGHVHRLVAGDYTFMPVGTWHALGNGGGEEVRWLSFNTPVRLAPDAGRRDSFFAREP